MAGFPTFSEDDRLNLRRLGVIDAQIERLRHARISIRVALRPPAPRNDVKAILEEIAKLSGRLLSKTAAASMQIDAAHATAHALIEQGYWSALPDDYGAHSFHCLAPRLNALHDAALAGIAGLPSTPSRSRTATPQPIAAIEAALRQGWTDEHGSNVFSARMVGGKEARQYPNGPQRKRYPVAFKPSAADGSVFRAVVGICYAAEGGNDDPIAAIKAYLQHARLRNKHAREALEAGLAAPAKRGNRTSRKT